MIQDYVNKKILGIGREYRGLYFLEEKSLAGMDDKLKSIIKHLLTEDKINLVVAGSTGCQQGRDSYEVWHQRLGHPPCQKLKHVSGLHLLSANSKVCVSCLMAKFARQPFKVDTNRSHTLCELIHMDIWGPYRVPTFKNCRFF